MHKFYSYQFRAPCLADGAWKDMIYGSADVLAPDWLIPWTRISWMLVDGLSCVENFKEFDSR